MQTLIQVIAKGEGSLRDRIAKDAKLEDYNLIVSEQKRQGRSSGWTKVHSLGGSSGAINLEWHSATRLLICRVVNRRGNKPNEITGDFINYLLGRHSSRLDSIQIVPRR